MPRPSEHFNLHPRTHGIDTLKTKEFDVICIGSGWAGRILAARVVKAGYSAIIVEKELFGGDCPFWACVPSKVLLRSQEALNAAKSVGGAKERITGSAVDVASVFARRDAITAHKDDTKVLVPMVEGLGITLLRGHARLSDVRKVKVTDIEDASIELEARLAVAVCSGSEAAIPKSVAAANPWTPRDVTSADYAPEHLIIMGGGVVGCEMATAYVGFGSKITLISSSAELLPAIDSEAGTLVRTSLESRGVKVIVGTRVTNASRQEDGQVEVFLSNGDKIHGSELLVAAGRSGILDFGFETIGLDVKSRTIDVDESLGVQTPDESNWLYAPGDINGRSPFTHAAKYQGKIAANAIIARAKGEAVSEECFAKADHIAMPQVIFTSPIVASVGLTHTTVAKRGKTVRQITAPFKTHGGILHSDSMSDGWAQWLVDDEERLVGMTIVGEDAAELLHAGTVTIMSKMKLSDLLHCIPAFPTMSEVYLNLLEAAGY